MSGNNHCPNIDLKKWTGIYQENEWRLYCGDSSEALKDIPPKSIHCVVTSPPYYCLRDYKIEKQIGLEETVQEYIDSLCLVFDEVYRVLKKDGLFFLNIGDTYYSGRGESQGKDPKSNKRRFGLRPVDKSGGLGIKLQKKSIIGVPWRVAIQLMSRKWILRTPIIWHRDKALPQLRIGQDEVINIYLCLPKTGNTILIESRLRIKSLMRRSALTDRYRSSRK